MSDCRIRCSAASIASQAESCAGSSASSSSIAYPAVAASISRTAARATSKAARAASHVPAPHLLALGIKFEAAFDHELKSAPQDDLRFRAVLMDMNQLWAAQACTGA